MKKIILLLSAAVVLISCSKVGKDEYIISGTAKGIENGKTIILQSQNEMGALIALDTVKVENEKFEIKGKVTEPAFHTIQLEAANGPIPFILESGEIKIDIDKDSIQKSKVSGTYSNDEYVKFNEEIKTIQKKVMDFQKQNMQAMNTAQQTKDTVVINKLMKEYNIIQEEVGTKAKAKYTTYAETHPKSFISALIIQGMVNDPSMDPKKAEAMYNSLDESLKNTKPGKEIKSRIDLMKNPSAGAPVPSVGDPK